VLYKGRFISARGFNPLIDFEPQLLKAWGDAHTKRIVQWDLVMKVGKRE
jgi:hypothetical protein